MEQQANDRIIDRIRKMLALAQDKAASEGERNNALRMAYATLEKYNLDLADVEASHQAGLNDPRVFHRFEGLSTDLWAMRAAQAIGKLFFCKYYREDNVRHVFVGRSMNVQTATYITEYVIQSIEREAKQGARDHFAKARSIAILLQQNIREAATPQKWADSFKEGAALAIYRRVEEMMKEATVNRAPGTALVLVSRYKTELALNEQMVKDQGITLGASHARSKSVSQAAAERGAAYGSGISLNRQVGNSSATLKLGRKD